MCYYGNVMTTTRWCLCVTMATLWQQQDGAYALLWQRYDNNKITSLFYDCTVDDVEYIYNKFSLYTELVIDVFYIFNSTVIDWTCFFFFCISFQHLIFRPVRNKSTSIPARNAQSRIRYFPKTHALSKRAVVCIIELPFKRCLQRRSCDDAVVSLTQWFAAPLFWGDSWKSLCLVRSQLLCVALRISSQQ